MKKILLVTYGFHPDQSPRSLRATELAIELARLGHEVTVLGPNRAGIDEFLNQHRLNYISYGEITWKVLQLSESMSIFKWFNRAMTRGLSLLFEYPSIQLVPLLRKKLKKLKGFDALISIAVPYPIHWGVASIWKIESLQNPAKVWIADCGDPYCGRENDTFSVPFYFAWVEKWFMRKCDFVTVPTQDAIKGYFKEFHDKIIINPQGFRFKEYKVLRTVPKHITHLVYGGGFIPGRRDPKELILLLNDLASAYHFRFDIYTNSPQFVKPHIKAHNHIFVHDMIPRDEFLEIASTADFLVNFANKGTVQTPSKLIDYAMLKKPVLNIVTGNLDTENVKKFLNGDYSGSLDIKDIDQYKIENVAKKFIDLMDRKI